MVSERLAAVTLAIGVDGGVVFKTTAYVKENKVVDAKSFLGPGPRDGETRPGVGLGQAVFRAGEPVC